MDKKKLLYRESGNKENFSKVILVKIITLDSDPNKSRRTK